MQGFKTTVQQLLIAASCPTCRRVGHADPTPCIACRRHYNLSDGCLSGLRPLPWRALALYEGPFRDLLLQIKRPGRTKPRVLPALMAMFRSQLALESTAQLVPIPSWKQRQTLRNPLPQFIAADLQRPVLTLLVRTRAGLGQHHLDRRMRLHNMRNAFTTHEQPTGQPLWLVDDILTTGATAMAAHQALQERGHHVSGILCLGRTPSNRR